MKKKIYLAGPDVFYPDSEERANHLKHLCEQNNFDGLYPEDNEVVPPSAENIRNSNIELIKSADGLIANLNSFRGFEPDSGTVFEVGYATALGIPVIGYCSDLRPMKQKLSDFQKLEADSTFDENGLSIENFELPHNLMFGQIVLANNAQEALMELKKKL